jgi:hypothetical protein
LVGHPFGDDDRLAASTAGDARLQVGATIETERLALVVAEVEQRTFSLWLDRGDAASHQREARVVVGR